MKEHTKYSHFRITYKDKDEKDRMMLFYDSGRVTQVRVYLDAQEKDVKSCFIMYSNTHFTKSPMEFMEKEFYRDTKLVNEYYTDGVLESYFEKELKPSFEIIRGFSGSGVLFSTEVIYKNVKGKPFAFYQQIDDAPGFYRKISREGAYSEKWFDSFEECLQISKRCLFEYFYN